MDGGGDAILQYLFSMVWGGRRVVVAADVVAVVVVGAGQRKGGRGCRVGTAWDRGRQRKRWSVLEMDVPLVVVVAVGGFGLWRRTPGGRRL